MERLAGGERSRSPHLALRGRGDLVETASADAACPARVADDREADDADVIETAAALRRVDERGMRVALGHEHVVDAVVDAACGAEAEHIPIVDERDAFDWQHEDARVVSTLHQTE